MLCALSIIFLCALGSSHGTRYGGRCPPRHTQVLMNCIAPIRRLQTQPSRNVAQMCSTMNTGLDCMGEIIRNCQHDPDIADLARMLNVDQVRAIVNSECGGGPAPTFQPGQNNNCPSDYTDQVMACVRPMQGLGQVTVSNVGQACGVAISGLECLDEILGNCAGQPEVQMMTSMLNIDTMRTRVSSECARYGHGAGGNNGNDNCRPGYETRMLECVEPMSQIDNLVSEDLNLACSLVTDGFGCLDTIIANCGDKPEVQAMVSALGDMTALRSSIDEMCSGGGTGIGGDSQVQINSTDTCPSGYERRLMECAGPMTDMGTVTAQNLDHACSVARDGLGCLQMIFDNCPNKPDVQEVASILDLETLRPRLELMCSGSGSPERPGQNAGCSNTARGLQRCSEELSSFQDNSLPMNVRCRNLYRGFDCFSRLIDRCPNDPDVVEFTSHIDINEARQSVAIYCPTKK